MAYVSNVIFCLNAITDETGNVNANSIFSSLTPEYVPGLFTFSVIVSILDLEIDSKNECHILIEFNSPTGENVVTVDTNTSYINNENNLPNEYKGINIAMDWTNVNFKTSGLYTLHISCNDEKIGEKQIFVKGKNEE